MMTKLRRFGKNKLGFLRIVFNAEVWRIIFGPWAFQDHAVLVLKSILIVAVPMAKRADQSLMKIDTLKFGTWCSCKTLEVKVEIRILSQLWVNCLLKILTLALVLNELLRSYKVLKIFMKLIPPESFLIKHPS